MGRLVEPGVERARPSAVSDGQARPRGRGPAAFLTVPRARASRDDLQAEGWTDSALHPVAPPAVAEGRTGSGTADRGDPAERRVGGHGADCAGVVRESTALPVR